MRDHRVKSLLKLIPAAFYALLFIFLALYLKGIDFSKFSQAEFVWKYVLLACLTGLFTRFWQAFIWVTLLKNLGAKNLSKEYRELLYVYAKSWLGRYIPGSATWLLGKIYFASKHGISKSKLAVSSLLEGGLQVTVVMAVALIMLSLDSRLDIIEARYKIIMLCLVAVCIFILIPNVFNKVISKIYKIIKKQSLHKQHLATNQTIISGAFLYIVGAIVSGLSLFFIAKAIYPSLPYSDMLFVMGAGNLASAASMIAIFAPSGLGVREGIQLTLLSLIMPTELALLVTITTRLWSVIMDFVFFGIARTIKRYATQIATY